MEGVKNNAGNEHQRTEDTEELSPNDLIPRKGKKRGRKPGESPGTYALSRYSRKSESDDSCEEASSIMPKRGGYVRKKRKDFGTLSSDDGLTMAQRKRVDGFTSTFHGDCPNTLMAGVFGIFEMAEKAEQALDTDPSSEMRHLRLPSVA